MLSERVAELEARLAELEELAESPARDTALVAIQGLLELYGAALARVLELAPEAVPRFQQDELVSHLLLLHDLHPVDVHTRVEGALESVRPYLATHGGNVQLLSVDDGVARVQLVGTCNGCASSRVTLTHAIEAAILQAAPDVLRVEAEANGPPSQIISLESLVCPLP